MLHPIIRSPNVHRFVHTEEEEEEEEEEEDDRALTKLEAQSDYSSVVLG